MEEIAFSYFLRDSPLAKIRQPSLFILLFPIKQKYYVARLRGG
jgi:hypothetical protein